MCKQKLSMGLLIGSLYAAQACAMQGSLENLRDRLVDLRGALQRTLPSGPGVQLPPPPPTGKPIILGTLPPPPSVQSVVVPPAPTPPPSVPGSTPTTTPLKPVQPNVPVQPVQHLVKPKAQGPVCPTPVTSGGLSPAEVAAQKAKEREQRTAAAAAAGKKQKPSGKVITRFVTLAKLAPMFYPTQNTVPNPASMKGITLEKERLKGNTIRNVIQQLGGEKWQTEGLQPETIKERKPRAKKLLNGLLYLVKNESLNPLQIKEAYELILLILNIDPLLITTANVVLHDLGFDDNFVHQLMIIFFEERIRFIGETLEALKIKASEGAIEDIDESFAYQIALSSELVRQESILLDEHSSAGQKQEAQWFIDRVKVLRKQLCDIITAPENIKLFKDTLQALYHMICGQQQKGALRVYCVTAPWTYGKTLAGKRRDEFTYCSFDQEINKIKQEISNFNQALAEGKMSTSQRVYTVQTIISSLADINTFFTNPDVCPNCLREAIRIGHPGASESAQVAEPFKQQLTEIAEFLLGINKKDNSFYLEDFVRNGMPKIRATLDRIGKLRTEESVGIYTLIGVNRLAKERGMALYTLDDYLHNRIPQGLLDEAERERIRVLSAY